ncbi:MAG: RDD family protein [Opitutaceae bacterium]|nr:RDD family protein [Opitutaceae bacterium]
MRREVENRNRGWTGPDLPRADFFQRLWALLIDIVLVAVGGGVSLAFALLPFPLLFGGYVFAMWQWKGTTVGGIIFNLQVVRLDGRPMDVATALVRTLVAFLSVVAAGLGFLWCLWDPEGQTWHDKVAGTVVVRVPKSTPLV